MKRFALLVTSVFLVSGAAHAAGKDFPSGPLALEPVIFQYTVYLIEPITENPMDLTKRILTRKYSHFKLADTPDPKQNSLRIRVNHRVQEVYRPPDLESLRRFGKGVSKDQAEKLQRVSSAIIIDVALPLKNRSSGLQDASQFIADLSKATNGVIWDEDTRQCFDADTWTAARIDTFQNGNPDVSSQITIHAYKDGDYIRAITLGMAKLGLPDIEVSDFSWSDNRNVGQLINLVAQLSYEMGIVQEAGRFRLNIDDIQHRNVRNRMKQSRYDNVEEEINIRIVEGIRDQGDPHNRIMEIIFDDVPGNNKQEKIDAMLSRLWGWKDNITQVQHNTAILAASEKARRKLPQIRKQIQKGLAPGEYYLVKAPFDTPTGGTEWMWVEVLSWEDKREIIGLLKNQPFYIPTLKAGARVTIQAEDVFDYIHRLSDGTSTGNETGALIRKYSQE